MTDADVKADLRYFYKFCACLLLMVGGMYGVVANAVTVHLQLSEEMAVRSFGQGLTDPEMAKVFTGLDRCYVGSAPRRHAGDPPWRFAQVMWTDGSRYTRLDACARLLLGGSSKADPRMVEFVAMGYSGAMSSSRADISDGSGWFWIF